MEIIDVLKKKINAKKRSTGRKSARRERLKEEECAKRGGKGGKEEGGDTGRSVIKGKVVVMRAEVYCYGEV